MNPSIRFILAGSVLWLALIALHHLLRRVPVVRSTPAPVVYEPVQSTYPDESDFWQWFDALRAQDDFSYAEARALYQLVDHIDLYTEEATTMPVEPESETT